MPLQSTNGSSKDVAPIIGAQHASTSWAVKVARQQEQNILTAVYLNSKSSTGPMSFSKATEISINQLAMDSTLMQGPFE